MNLMMLAFAAGLSAAAAPEPASLAEERVDRPAALLKGLDKFSGRVADFEAPVDEPVRFERLTVTVRACRVSARDEGDAVAFLQIDDTETRVFSGWMFAEDPAISALDHPRYDVWVAACRTSSGEAS